MAAGEPRGPAEPIDWTIVKKDALPPNAVVADGFGIAQNILGTALCYRSDKYREGGPALGRTSGTLSGFPATAAFALAIRRER